MSLLFSLLLQLMIKELKPLYVLQVAVPLLATAIIFQATSTLASLPAFISIVIN